MIDQWVDIALLGFLPAILVFIFAYAVTEGRERALLSLAVAGGTAAFCWVVFHVGIKVNWPYSYLGDWWPALRELTGFL